MAFADPQVVAINAVNQSMPRIETKGLSSVYQKADLSHKLTISHTPQRDRTRSMVRIDYRAVVADPLTNVNDYETVSFYVVLDRPQYGFSQGTIENLILGLTEWITGSGTIGRLIGNES